MPLDRETRRRNRLLLAALWFIALALFLLVAYWKFRVGPQVAP